MTFSPQNACISPRNFTTFADQYISFIYLFIYFEGTTHRKGYCQYLIICFGNNNNYVIYFGELCD